MGHIHAGRHSLLPKRQRIDSAENNYHMVCNGQLAYRVNKVYCWLACDVTAAMLVYKNNKIFLLWDLTSIFMQTM